MAAMVGNVSEAIVWSSILVFRPRHAHPASHAGLSPWRRGQRVNNCPEHVLLFRSPKREHDEENIRPGTGVQMTDTEGNACIPGFVQRSLLEIDWKA